MAAVEIHSVPSRMSRRRGVLAVLAAALIGAAFIPRGSGFSPLTADIVQSEMLTLQDGRSLRVQTREVTVVEWQVCHDAGMCSLDLSRKMRDADFPATGLSYPDAMQFVTWINTQSGLQWRLPSAAEWREIAKEVMPKKADPIFTDPSLTWASSYLTEAKQTGRALRPSGAFSTTSTGIIDLDGNVWEWTSDCYAGADGKDTINPDRCPAFFMGGEHEAVMSYLIRDPARGGCAVGAPPAHLGMRLVADSN